MKRCMINKKERTIFRTYSCHFQKAVSRVCTSLLCPSLHHLVPILSIWNSSLNSQGLEMLIFGVSLSEKGARHGRVISPRTTQTSLLLRKGCDLHQNARRATYSIPRPRPVAVLSELGLIQGDLLLNPEF